MQWTNLTLSFGITQILKPTEIIKWTKRSKLLNMQTNKLRRMKNKNKNNFQKISRQPRLPGWLAQHLKIIRLNNYTKIT
jgi:hypothetical protein